MPDMFACLPHGLLGCYKCNPISDITKYVKTVEVSDTREPIDVIKAYQSNIFNVDPKFCKVSGHGWYSGPTCVICDQSYTCKHGWTYGSGHGRHCDDCHSEGLSIKKNCCMPKSKVTEAKNPDSFNTETEVIDPKTGGAKSQKVERYDLLPFEALDEVTRVYGKGAIKRSEFNWRKGYSWRLSLGALLRHISLWSQGHDWDTPDGLPQGDRVLDEKWTGRHHMGCVAWHALTLLTFHFVGLGTDDRVYGKNK